MAEKKTETIYPESIQPVIDLLTAILNEVKTQMQLARDERLTKEVQTAIQNEVRTQVQSRIPPAQTREEVDDAVQNAQEIFREISDALKVKARS